VELTPGRVRPRGLCTTQAHSASDHHGGTRVAVAGRLPPVSVLRSAVAPVGRYRRTRSDNLRRVRRGLPRDHGGPAERVAGVTANRGLRAHPRTRFPAAGAPQPCARRLSRRLLGEPIRGVKRHWNQAVSGGIERVVKSQVRPHQVHSSNHPGSFAPRAARALLAATDPKAWKAKSRRSNPASNEP
jgi:hypothetical protein